MPDPQVVAHRGDVVAHVENTLEAVDAAIADGSTVVEVDVRTTADHVPVLLHDETLARLWGRDAPLREVPAAEVAALRGPGGVRVPTLAETLALAAGRARLLLDLPDHRDPEQIVAVAAGHDVAWCGDHAAMAVVRDLDPDAVLYLTWSEAAYPSDALLERLRPAYINPLHLVLDHEWVRHFVERGIQVSAWTVDDPVRLDYLRSLGVASVTSNHPAALRRHMRLNPR